jgi:hypothetical protein
VLHPALRPDPARNGLGPPVGGHAIKSVNVFDGVSENLLEGYDVLVVCNLIKQVAKDIPTEGTYELDMKADGLREETVQAACTHVHTVTVYDGPEKIE